ncbi:hypothetical protein [Streptomyces sp. NPDC002588]
MSLALNSLNPGVEWLGEPDLAVAGRLTHVDQPFRGFQPDGPEAAVGG